MSILLRIVLVLEQQWTNEEFRICSIKHVSRVGAQSLIEGLAENPTYNSTRLYGRQKRFPPRLIGCRGAAPLFIPPEDVPRPLLSASLSSSLDILDFGLLVGR